MVGRRAGPRTARWAARIHAGCEALPGWEDGKWGDGRESAQPGTFPGSQDLWMFPNVLMFHPEAARALLEYRIRTLAGALDNARNLGYQVRGS